MGLSLVTADTPVADLIKKHPSVKFCAGGCGRYTRTGRMRAVDFPGTVVRGNDTTCQRCLNHARTADGELTQKPKVAEEKLSATITSLDAFMEARRNRKARQTSAALNSLEQFQHARTGR